MRFLPSMLQFRRPAAGDRVMREQDPADLGTAFGMEACLGEEMDYVPINTEGFGLESRAQEAPMSWLSRRALAR
jgi:hypothetical protein